MPRNKNYSLQAERQATTQQLRKTNAIINAVRTGDINKAEYLSGEDLIPRDPVLQALQTRESDIEAKHRKSTKEQNQAILKQLEAIAAKPDFDYNKFVRTFKRMIEDQETFQQALEAPLPDSDDEADETLQPQIDLAEDEQVPFPDNLPYSAIIGAIDYVPGTIYPKESIDVTTDPEILQKYLDYHMPRLNAYYDRLHSGHRGQHLIKNHKQHLENYENYRKYLAYIRARLDKLQEPQQGTSILTSMSEVLDRLKLLLGEIEAGNTNKALQNEFNEILHYLYSKHKISKQTYKTNLI